MIIIRLVPTCKKRPKGHIVVAVKQMPPDPNRKGIYTHKQTRDASYNEGLPSIWNNGHWQSSTSDYRQYNHHELHKQTRHNTIHVSPIPDGPTMEVYVSIHLAREDNQIADYLSRQKTQVHTWELFPMAFNDMHSQGQTWSRHIYKWIQQKVQKYYSWGDRKRIHFTPRWLRRPFPYDSIVSQSCNKILPRQGLMAAMAALVRNFEANGCQHLSTVTDSRLDISTCNPDLARLRLTAWRIPHNWNGLSLRLGSHPLGRTTNIHGWNRCALLTQLPPSHTAHCLEILPTSERKRPAPLLIKSILVSHSSAGCSWFPCLTFLQTCNP